MVCLGVLQMVGLLYKIGLPQIAEVAGIAFSDDPGLPAYLLGNEDISRDDWG